MGTAQFSHSVVSDSATPGTAACQASLSITNSWTYSNSCPSRWWCHPTISSSFIPFSGGLVTKSRLTLVTPWTIACPAPLSTGFSRQEYWIGLPFPSPGVLPDPGIEPGSPALQTDSLPTELWGKPLSGGKGCQMWQRSWRRRHSGWVISESPWVENAQLNIEYWVWNISQSGNQDSWPMSETDILCALRAYFLNL